MKIVICGSMSASKEMMNAKKYLKERGHSIEIPRNTEKYANGNKPPEKHFESTKNKLESNLIQDYYNKIKESDAVLVINTDKNGNKNYVGGNTFLELGFAHVLDKKVYMYNPIPDMLYTDELLVFQPTILNGDLSKIK